jgi:hypothetical protein
MLCTGKITPVLKQHVMKTKNRVKIKLHAFSILIQYYWLHALAILSLGIERIGQEAGWMPELFGHVRKRKHLPVRNHT